MFGELNCNFQISEARLGLKDKTICQVLQNSSPKRRQNNSPNHTHKTLAHRTIKHSMLSNKIIALTLLLYALVVTACPAFCITLPDPKNPVIDASKSRGFLTRVTTLKKPLFESNSGGYVAAPHVDSEDRIYVAPGYDSEGALVELNSKGKVKSWPVVGSINGEPFDVPGDRIGVLTTQALFLAIDKKTRKVIIEKDIGSGVSGSGVKIGVDEKPAIIFANADGELVTVDPTSGERLTTTKIGDNLIGTPVIKDGIVALRSQKGVFYVGTDFLNPNSFRKFATSSQTMSQPVFGKSHVYISANGGNIYAVPLNGGRTISISIGSIGTMFRITAPVVLDDGQTIIVADWDGLLHFFGPELQRLAPPVHVGDRFSTDMRLSKDERFLAIGTGGGECMIYDLKAGIIVKESGRGPINAPATFGPNGTVYFADEAGSVHILKINSDVNLGIH
jgi:hypothetical protein